jgi:glycosyltransferase involved in cell wall biosynthesis
MMKPRISVLMPIYNREVFLQEAIESILRQTFDDFEFLLLDDGSTDRTAEIAMQAAAQDARIRYQRWDQNRGIAAVMSEGITLARGEYVAQMDSDDISLPDRFARQVAFLDAHPEVGVCGAWICSFRESGRENISKPPLDHESIHARMIFSNPIKNPAVMVRGSFLRSTGLTFDPAFVTFSDYDFWSRAVVLTKFANLPEVLLRYRIHSATLTISGKDHWRRAVASEFRLSIYRRMLGRLGLQCSDDDLQLHHRIGAHREKDNAADGGENDLAYVRRARTWLENLHRANQTARLIDPEIFVRELGRHWRDVCRRSNAPALDLFGQIFASPLPFGSDWGMRKLWSAARISLFRRRSV